MEENRESEAQGTEVAHAHTRAPAGTYVRARFPRSGTKAVRRAQNKALNAQAQAAKTLAIAAQYGVDPIPLLPQGQQASTRAFLEARLKQGNGALSLALADRILNDALDTSGNRSLDAARLALEQTEDARVKRTETTQRSARIVLNYGAPQGGMSESASGPMLESQTIHSARVVDASPAALPAAPVSSSEPVPVGGDVSPAVGSHLLESRIQALEQGQQQVLEMLQKLLEATVSREVK